MQIELTNFLDEVLNPVLLPQKHASTLTGINDKNCSVLIDDSTNIPATPLVLKDIATKRWITEL